MTTRLNMKTSFKSSFKTPYYTVRIFFVLKNITLNLTQKEQNTSNH